MTTAFTYRVMDQNSFAVAAHRGWSTLPAALRLIDKCARFGFSICEKHIYLAEAAAL